MSLILEALRKSEAERQREGAPSVAMELPPVPARGTGPTPGWVWPTLAAIVAVAVLVGWLGMRAGKHDRAENAATTAAATESAAATASKPQLEPARTPATTPSATPAPMPRMAAEPAPATSPASAVAVPAPVPARAEPAQTVEENIPPPIATSQPPRALPPAPASAPVRAPASAATSDAEDAPPIAATGLPAVKLSMHMWDADPSRRFVILDGQRMGEGDRSGGLQVIAIRRDGVIIERNGIRARVPLP